MVDEIEITDDISIPIEDIEFHAIRAQGAGGQNVNKVASAIHLRFDYRQCEALPPQVRERLAALDDQRIGDRHIVIKAQEHRSQSRNRQAAIERLKELISSALVKPKPRIATRPSRKAKKKRVDEKRRAGRLKRSRGPVSDD